MLWGLDELREIIRVTFWTGSVLQNSIPVGTMIVSQPGAAKSRMVLPFTGDSIHQTNDLTSKGLHEMIVGDKNQKIQHIILSDFNAVLSHRGKTSELTIANLLSLTSEGVVRIDDGRQQHALKHTPIGLVLPVTRQMYENYYDRWNATGFIRRFLVLHFTYSAATIEVLQRKIADGQIRMVLEKEEVLTLPKKPAAIIWRDDEKNRLIKAGDELSKNLASVPDIRWTRAHQKYVTPSTIEPPYPMTPQQILQSMAEAHARKSGRGTVQKDDMDFIFRVLDYTKYSEPKKL